MFDQLTPLHIAIYLLWLISAIADYSEFCYLWQLKEYRLDRFRDFLSTHAGRRYFVRYNIFWRSFAVLAALLFPINNVTTLQYILIFLFSIDATRLFILLLRKRWQHPVITVKAVLIIASAILFEVMLILLIRDWSFVCILLVTRFFLIGIVVQLFQIPTRWIKKWYIFQAKKKLSKYPGLIIIGITGSYGKSSVKHFLNHILRKKYRVVATPKNTNTDIGVAKIILQTDFSNVDVFVVEMGAYRKGEIQAICDMVRPNIGILTAINAQHVSLFGSIENTRRAKYELLQSVPKDGLVITNADNPYCMQGVRELRAPVQTFGTEDVHATCRVVHTEQGKEGIRATLEVGGRVLHLTAPLLGVHNAMNIAACILAASYLGMTLTEITEQVQTLQPPPHTLKKFVYGQAIVIDDSYNANPDGFLAALDVLNSFSHDWSRVVITRGIPELGEKSGEVHEHIGGAIAHIVHTLILVNHDFEEPLRRGMGNNHQTEIVIKDNPKELHLFVQSYKQQKVVILIENRIPAGVALELCGTKK